MPLEQVRRIVFIRTDRLGETLLNLPAVAALNAALPNASLSLLVHPDLQELLASLPGIERVLADDPPKAHRWWIQAVRTARMLKPHQFDLAIVSNPKKALHLAVWLAGIPHRVGYDRKWGRLLTNRLEDRKALGERHEVEYNLDLVRALGLPTQVPALRFPHLPHEHVEIAQLLDQAGVQPSDPMIAVHPWTSNPSKQWPIQRYRMLIQRLALERSAQVVVIGGPEVRHQAPSVLPSGVRVVDLVGRLTLTQLAALLQRAKLLVSNDSGPVHLASAVGTPTLVLFGAATSSTGPGRWGPWGPGHTVIGKPSIGEIGVDEVFAAAQRALSGLT